MRRLRAGALVGVLAAFSCAAPTDPGSTPSQVTILNVSYDPTREFYQQINLAFARNWLASAGQTVTIEQSHGGSGRQARAVIDGLQADVVTLALAYDIDAIHANGALIDRDWQSRLPTEAHPTRRSSSFWYGRRTPRASRTGTIWPEAAFPSSRRTRRHQGVRAGTIWRPGVTLRQFNGSESAASDLVGRIYRNVPVLDSGARGSLTTFVQRQIGDVLIAWESEALLARKTMAGNQFEIVIPSETILAEPPVAVVDRVVDKRGTRKVAQAYLEFLYSPEGQDIAAAHFFRPQSNEVLARYASQFPRVTTFTLADVFGSWSKAQAMHFDDGGTFDQIYQPGS